MAEKATLRDFQLRLADRLQAVRERPRESGWLAVECAGLGLLLPLAQAGEIFNAPGVLAVPHTKAWFRGLANLRGDLHGVIDLAAFLFLRPPAAAEGEGADAARAPVQLVALNPSLRVHAALQVDRLAGLREAAQLRPEPEAAHAPASFAGSRWRDDDGRFWQALDLAALASHPAFLDIVA